MAPIVLQHLRLGVEVDAELALVERRGSARRRFGIPGWPSSGGSARLCGLRELLDRELGRREIGVAEPEVDDVVTGSAQLQLEVRIAAKTYGGRLSMRRNSTRLSLLHLSGHVDRRPAYAALALNASSEARVSCAPTATTSPTTSSAGDSSAGGGSAISASGAVTDSWSGSVPRETTAAGVSARQPCARSARGDAPEPLERHEEDDRAAAGDERRVVGLAAVGAVRRTRS